jgi:hypothetical protein
MRQVQDPDHPTTESFTLLTPHPSAAAGKSSPLRKPSPAGPPQRIEVGGGSITEAGIVHGGAIVVRNVRDDPRYNRTCDRSDCFFGESLLIMSCDPTCTWMR